MKIASVLSILALVSPVVTALKGARKDNSRWLQDAEKGGDEDEDDDGLSIPGVDDEILDTTLGDVLDQVLEDVELPCFSESSTVQVQNRGPIAMKDLQVGDMVLTEKRYQPVYAFGHKEVDAMGKFIQLTTEQGTLEITGEHLVFVDGQDHPVRADDVQVGDILRASTAPLTVTQIGSVVKQGLYAPLTNDGTIVVDNVIASSYVSFQKNANMVQISGVNTPLSHHTLLHMAASPLRMLCSMTHCDSNDSRGLAPFVAQAIQFSQWSQEQHFTIQILCLVFAFALFAAFMVVENTMGAPLVLAAAYGLMKANGISMRKVKTA